jgi:hypothetical protein
MVLPFARVGIVLCPSTFCRFIEHPACLICFVLMRRCAASGHHCLCPHARPPQGECCTAPREWSCRASLATGTKIWRAVVGRCEWQGGPAQHEGCAVHVATACACTGNKPIQIGSISLVRKSRLRGGTKVFAMALAGGQCLVGCKNVTHSVDEKA